MLSGWHNQDACHFFFCPHCVISVNNNLYGLITFQRGIFFIENENKFTKKKCIGDKALLHLLIYTAFAVEYFLLLLYIKNLPRVLDIARLVVNYFVFWLYRSATGISDNSKSFFRSSCRNSIYQNTTRRNNGFEWSQIRLSFNIFGKVMNRGKKPNIIKSRAQKKRLFCCLPLRRI